MTEKIGEISIEMDEHSIYSVVHFLVDCPHCENTSLSCDTLKTHNGRIMCPSCGEFL